MLRRNHPTHASCLAAAPFLVVFALALVAGCAAQDPTDPGATRAAATAVAPSPSALPVAPARPLDAVAIELAPVDAAAAAEAEDGSGNVVRPIAPVAIDVTASREWPARALDPVLYVGALHFHGYRYVEPNKLRFVVADRATLPVGTDPYVQYGPDELSRVVMARGWVPR